MASVSLTLRLRDALSAQAAVLEKRMFGGVAFLLRGHMLVGVWNDSLVARVGPEAYEDALLEEHVRIFDVAGKPMRGWVTVEPEGLESDRQLRDWIERAARFVETLPAKR